jgi:hypothetical protein
MAIKPLPEKSLKNKVILIKKESLFNYLDRFFLAQIKAVISFLYKTVDFSYKKRAT